MQLFVADSALSVSAQLLARFVAKDVKVTIVNDAVQNSEEFKAISPKGEIPAIKSKDGSAAGLYDVAKILAPASLLGTTDTQQKEVLKWCKLLTSDLIPQWKAKDNRWVGKIHKINKDLVATTFMLGNQLTLVDFGLFPLFHSAIQSWSDNDRLMWCNIVRWFDFMQHYDRIKGALPQLTLVAINKYLSQQGTPTSESKADLSDQKEAKEEKKEQPKKEEVKPQVAKEQAQEDKKEQPKEAKKQAKPAEKKEKQPPKQPEKPVDISRIDIRIGKIVKVERHKDAESLYVEQIDLGEEKPRTIVSGLVKFVPIEEMQDRLVAVVCNLKPAKLRGILSEGMVLAASNADHTQVELLNPPSDAKPGERVVFDGYSGEPDKELNPKQKVWEAIQPELLTTEDCTAVWKGIPFKTSGGVLKVKSIAKGTIK